MDVRYSAVLESGEENSVHRCTLYSLDKVYGEGDVSCMGSKLGLGEVLTRTGRELYHEIVRVAGYSLLSSLVLIPLFFFVPTLLAVALLPVLYAPAVFGVIAVFHRKAEGRPWGVKELFAETVRGFFPALVFGSFLALLGLILFASWWYYGGKEGILPLSFAVFQTYFIVMVLVSQFYTLSLVIEKGKGIFWAIAESALLFFKHPAYTIGAFLQLVVVTAALLATLVGFAVLWAGAIGLYVQKATANVLKPEAIDADAAQEEEASCIG